MQSRYSRLFILGAFVLISLWVLGWLFTGMMSPVGGKMKMTVMIPRGASAGEIAGILAEKKLIRNSTAFRILVRISGKGADLKPGAYQLSTDMTPGRILDMIAKGEVSSQWITFPEGYTISRIAERLQEEGFARKDRFLELAGSSGQSFQTNFPKQGESLEGYLFPDTYLIPSGASEEVIIGEMLDAFQHKVADSLSSDLSGSGMNWHQVITVASLIEREARVPKDRPLVAAVIYNRLRKNMRLEIDATVLYALGEHKDRVLYRDLEVDSPYNTYRNFGLPPGPIANPGLASIKAALHPAQVDYLFYVARPDGSHIFSRTLDEHIRAKQTARRKGAG